MGLILEALTTFAEYLCQTLKPKRMSDALLLKRVCPLIWFLLLVLGLSILVYEI